MKVIVNFFLLTILIFSCKGSIKYQNESNNSINGDSININTTKENLIKNGSLKEENNFIQDSISWKLIDVQRFFEEPIEQSDYKRFKTNKIYFIGDTIFINKEKALFNLKEMDFKKMLGKGSLYKYVTQYLEGKYKIDISKKVTLLNISDDDSNKSVFSEFFFGSEGGRVYIQPLIIDDYLFLYTKDDYFLTYKAENFKSFQKVYSKLPIVTLPIKFNLDFFMGDDSKFKPISILYGNFLDLNDLNSYTGVKLPDIAQNIKVLLVSAYNETGEGTLSIYTLSQDYKVIEKLDLYYITGETDSGKGIGRELNSISEDYIIKITDFLDTGKELENQYKISKQGKFEKVK